jgi:RimJ/RimL family protein N-acetyltransferase
MRHRGIGTALLDAVVLAARNRGHPVIRVTCLPTNEPMRRLAERADARLALTHDDAEGEIRAPRATMLSRLREAAGDAFDTVGAMMRVPLADASAA